MIMKKLKYIIFTAIIIALCAAPLMAMALGYKPLNRENRPLARFPELIERDGGLNIGFSSDFDTYFKDNFGLREEMVTAFHSATIALTRDTLNRKVIVGTGGMLFFSETLDDYLGLNLLSEEDIYRIATSLRLQQEFVESLGARFVFSIAPNKNTIYPEYMPFYLRPTGAVSNREALYAALAAQNVETLDFAQILIERKGDGLLYYPRDTHWNDRGAIIGYNAIMAAVFPECTAPDFLKTYRGDVFDHAGDLHNFVVPALPGTEVRPAFDIPSDYAVGKGARPGQDITFRTASTAEDAYPGRLYMMRDSFAINLIPLLSSTIDGVVYSSEFPYNYVRVMEEAPNAIAIELVERNIKNLLWSAPLMPAVEKAVPDYSGAYRIYGGVTQKTRSGFTQLYGSYMGVYGEPIYIILTGDYTHCFEAFPFLEEPAFGEPVLYTPLSDEEWLAMVSWSGISSGFTLTLPDYVHGDYAVTLVCGDMYAELGTIIVP